jgi:type II secretory pathway pseudopilin PulG
MGGFGGITLIELVITMVLIGIIAYIVATALSTGIKAYFVTDLRKEALDQARIAMERMAREIRNVRDNTSITAADADTFTFTDTDGTLITFELSGTNLMRNTNTLSVGISSLAGAPFTTGIFAYVMADGTITQTPAPLSAIRGIKIGLKSTVQTETVELYSEVWPRNL